MTPPLIAVDLDDVIAQTNAAVADWHNQTHGTNMTLDDFHYYHYWKNPHWGTPDETLQKVKQFYVTDLMKPVPVPGALEGLRALKEMGYAMAIVTARHESESVRTRAWLDTYFPDIFTSVTCTGQFQRDGEGKQVHVKMSKADVCHRLGARLLIDDSVENALHCASASPAIPVLLFGMYSWNERESRVDAPEDALSFDARLEAEGGREWWKTEKVELPRGVVRVTNWAEVLDTVRGGAPHHS